MKNSWKWVMGVWLIGWCLHWHPLVSAEEQANASEKPQGKAADANWAESLSLSSRRDPIRISSRDLEFLYDQKRIVYRGEVVAVQGDVTMKSDRLTVVYEDATAGTAAGGAAASSKQRLKEIVAEGKVDIISGNRHATGQKAVFNEAKRTVVLSGEARVQELGNWVAGERVTVYLDEKRSVVEGGSDRRAEMEIRPEQQEGDKKGSKQP